MVFFPQLLGPLGQFSLTGCWKWTTNGRLSPRLSVATSHYRAMCNTNKVALPGCLSHGAERSVPAHQRLWEQTGTRCSSCTRILSTPFLFAAVLYLGAIIFFTNATTVAPSSSPSFFVHQHQQHHRGRSRRPTLPPGAFSPETLALFLS